MATTYDFDSFWDLATALNQARNSLSYHICCDVWSKRGSKRYRKLHKQELKWNQVMTSLSKEVPDKKLALQAKMIEEGWRIPVLLNKPCQVLPLRQVSQQSYTETSETKLPTQGHICRSGAFNVTQLHSFQPLQPLPTYPPRSFDINEVLQRRTSEFYGQIKMLTNKLNIESKMRLNLQTQVDELREKRRTDKEKIFYLKSKLKRKNNRVSLLETKFNKLLRRMDEFEANKTSETQSYNSEYLHRQWGTQNLQEL